MNIPEEVIEIINEGENEDFDLQDLEDIQEIFLDMENKNLFIIQ